MLYGCVDQFRGLHSRKRVSVIKRSLTRIIGTQFGGDQSSAGACAWDWLFPFKKGHVKSAGAAIIIAESNDFAQIEGRPLTVFKNGAQRCGRKLLMLLSDSEPLIVV